MPEIRRLSQEESKLHDAISSICFNYPFDPDKEESKEDKELASPAEWSWGYFLDGELCSALQEIPYQVRLDGNDVAMSGIGDVVTLPHYRRGGKVRALFAAMLNDAYEKGTALSALAPFSHSFYRKFGYEVCNDRYRVVLQRKAFSPPVHTEGRITQHMPGQPTDDLQAIYRAYTQNVNLAVVRDAWPNNRAWRIFTRRHPSKDGVFRYIWHDDAGEPRAYAAFSRDGRDNDELTLNVREIAYADAAALRAMLGFFSQLQFGKLAWTAPTFLTIGDLFPECWDFQQTRTPRDMFRVVNVKSALTAMRRPAGEGEYTLQVRDPMLAQNEGRLLVEYGPEGTRVSPTQRDADLTAEIPALSQLITGYRDLDSALFARQDIQLHGNAGTLRSVFTARPTHLTEDF